MQMPKHVGITGLANGEVTREDAVAICPTERTTEARKVE
jgi:hypothetical protein